MSRMLMKSFLGSAAFLLLVGHDVVAQSLPPVKFIARGAVRGEAAACVRVGIKSRLFFRE